MLLVPCSTKHCVPDLHAKQAKSQLCGNTVANSVLALLKHTHISYIAIAIGIRPCMIRTHTPLLSSHTYTPLTVSIPNRRHSGSRDNDHQQHLHVDYYLQQVNAGN